MSNNVDGTGQGLDRSLSRMQAALARVGAKPLSAAQSTARLPDVGRLGGLLLGLSAGAFGLALATGIFVFAPLGIALVISGGILLRRGQIQRGLPPPPGAPARIGLGATISSSATIEGGATVEMGATVKPGAIIRSGALVGMGSTVGANAIIESGAVVSWGATVRAGGVVGANAIVGWGATVGKGVHVPAGMRLRAGSTVSSGWLRELLPGTPTANASPAPQRDATKERAALVCARLATELREAPPHVRAFLGASDDTITSLGRMCTDLSRREQALRAELAPEKLARLDEEKRAVGARLAAETDERIRLSLTGASAAIDEQARQLDLLRLSADRLEAERTRLLYTLESLASQFVRLRTAGDDAGRVPSTDLEQGMKDLGAELDAIAEALEHESPDSLPSGTRVRG